MISIRYFTPAPALRSLLSSYYWFESNAPAFNDLMRAELPQIRIVTKGTAINRFATGAVRTTMPIQLQGPTSGAVQFAATGTLHLFGVGLLPQGWATLLGVPADALADDMTDLAGIIGPAALVFADAIAAATSDAARVAAADSFFLALLARAHASPLWFTRLTDDWLTSSVNPDLDRLVAASGMSARSVERMAKRIYGASPKLLARKYRALQTAVQIGNDEVCGWSDIAAGGYYDQAHFIREFKQFTGLTPKSFKAEAAAVTRLTIARKKLLPDLPKLAFYS